MSSPKLQAYVVSKNRAAQCELLLESLERCFPDLFQVHIQYLATTPDYADGYNLLKYRKSTADVRFYKEVDLREGMISALTMTESPLCCILTDDSIFYRREDATVKNFSNLFEFEDLLTFSFRLGFNTIVQDYATGRLQQPLAESEPFCQFRLWNWFKRHALENYGYPFAMDGHMYRTTDLLDTVKRLDFSKFRSWEGTYALDRRSEYARKPLMASFQQSVLVNVPTNCVQDPPIPCGNRFPLSVEHMNDRYLAGGKIDYDKIEFGQIVGCHQEIELPWK